MKIIHTGDLHLKKFYRGRVPIEVSNKLLEDIWYSFSSLCDFSNKVDADIFLIAGDLFERDFFDLKDLERFLDLIKNLSAKVFVVFGNHDYLAKDNLFLKVDLPENLYIFKDELNFYELKELNTRVYGISYNNYNFRKEFQEINLDKSFINIGLFHSDLCDNRYMPLSEDFLKNFSYVALGHIHKRGKVFDNAYYCGSLIPLSFKEEGEHGIIFLDDDRKEIEFKNFSKRKFVNLEIKINSEMTFSEILKKVQSEIERENLYRIKLVGSHKHFIEIENFLEENLNAFYFELENEVLPERDLENFKIEEKHILELLNSFSDKDMEKDARKLSEKYILEQYYDI